MCVYVCVVVGSTGGDLELQPNASAPLLRNSKARREWIEQEMELCSTSWQYQKVNKTYIWSTFLHAVARVSLGVWWHKMATQQCPAPSTGLLCALASHAIYTACA